MLETAALLLWAYVAAIVIAGLFVKWSTRKLRQEIYTTQFGVRVSIKPPAEYQTLETERAIMSIVARTLHGLPITQGVTPGQHMKLVHKNLVIRLRHAGFPGSTLLQWRALDGTTVECLLEEPTI